MAKPQEKPKKQIKAVGLERDAEGWHIVTVLADESEVVERTAGDTLYIQKFELKKAWVRLVAEAQEHP